MSNPPPLVLGFVSLAHSCRAIARTALAYSNIRWFRWRLAYLDLPLLFLLFGAMHTAHLDTLTSLGTASAHLQRGDESGAVKAPARARWLWLILLSVFALIFVVIPTALVLVAIAVAGPAPARAVPLAWLVVVLGVPLADYCVPAAFQAICIGRIRPWATSTAMQTGREPVMVIALGSWPATGGGLRGTGDGFVLIKALTAEARSRNQIMIGAARGLRLGRRYVGETHAVPSKKNPRHLRWP